MSQSIKRRRAPFREVENEERLPIQSVYSLLQDRSGFIWIGRQRGLMRLAGNHGRLFLPDRRDPGSVPGKFILAIEEDHDGMIWIATYDGGCGRYNPRTESFKAIDLEYLNENDRIIRSFHPTSDGAVWVASHASLTRYDPDTGEVRKLHHPEVDDPRIIGRDHYLVLEPVDENRMLVGTQAGLFIVEIDTGSFHHISFSERGLLGKRRHSIGSIARMIDSHGVEQIMFTSGRQLYRLGTVDQTRLQRSGLDESYDHYLVHLVEPLVNPMTDPTRFELTSLAPDSQAGRLWIGTKDGLLRFDEVRECYDLYLQDSADPCSIVGSDIRALLHDRSGMLWVGTGVGVSLLDLRYNFEYHAVTQPGTERPISVTALAFDPVGSSHWIGTPGGLFRYNVDSGEETEYHLERGEGELRFEVREREADTLVNVVNDDSLQSKPEDGEVGNRDSMTDGEVTESEAVQCNSVRTIYLGENIRSSATESEPRSLWIGSDNGLLEFDLDACRVLRRYQTPSDPSQGETYGTVLGRYIKGIVEDDSGKIWSGCDTLGIQSLELSHNSSADRRFHYYRYGAADDKGLPHHTLLTSLRDRNGRLWFGFGNSLSLYIEETDTFTSWGCDPGDPESLSNGMVLSLYEDDHGRLWVGTAGGLNLVIERSSGDERQTRPDLSFQQFGTPEGLPVDFIVSITGYRNQLWLGTNRGLLSLQIESEPEAESGGSEKPQKRVTLSQIRLYTESDGLHSLSCFLGAIVREPTGHIAVGGESGFDRFHPDRILPDKTPPPVQLTALRLMNRRVIVDGESLPTQSVETKSGSKDNRSTDSPLVGYTLPESITTIRRIEIPWQLRMVTINFAPLHFMDTEKISCSYRLAGLDTGWVNAGSERSATFTNLGPGTYRFEVIATNSSGVRSLQAATVELHVVPPLWRRWWAHGLYGLASTAALTLFTGWRIAEREREMAEEERIEQARTEERERLRRENASDFHDESGTTLTRILFLIELARRQGKENPELLEIIDNIESNASRLSHDMRDFVWALDPDRDTLLDTLQRIELAGESLFEPTSVDFSMEYDHQQLEGIRLGLSERRQLVLICKEGLNNVARHAFARKARVAVHLNEALSGHAELNHTGPNQTLLFVISDDGVGFDTKSKCEGYGLKSLTQRAEKIGAEFFLNSRPGDGTVLQLRLRLDTTAKK